MANQFIYAPSNELWLNEVKEFNPNYNTLPFDYWRPNISYYYKVQSGDISRLQCLSDWLPVLEIIDVYGKVVDSVLPGKRRNNLGNQTFSIYEFNIKWANYSEGVYTVEIRYTNDAGELKIWRSDFIELKAKWHGTLLFNYTNSENKHSVIWDTGIVMSLRVEGNIADHTPAFDDIIYNDQNYNVTKLNSIPHREFNLYIGSTRGFQGVPSWIADKLNWVFACDQIQIDGVAYQNTSGSKWEVKRTDPDGTNFIGLKLPIIEVENTFSDNYNTVTTYLVDSQLRYYNTQDNKFIII